MAGDVFALEEPMDASLSFFAIDLSVAEAMVTLICALRHTSLAVIVARSL
jgi:hypothetical protein